MTGSASTRATASVHRRVVQPVQPQQRVGVRRAQLRRAAPAERHVAAQPPGGVGRHVGVAAVGQPDAGRLGERGAQRRPGQQLQGPRPAVGGDQVEVAHGGDLDGDRRQPREPAARLPQAVAGVGGPLAGPVQVQVGRRLIQRHVLRPQQPEGRQHAGRLQGARVMPCGEAGADDAERSVACDDLRQR